MGSLILLNDVSTEIEESGLLVGDSDPVASKLGNQQVDQIVSVFYSRVKKVDILFSSDAKRILKLTHHLRSGSADNSLSSLDVRRLEILRERGFGVLNRSPVFLSGDMFSEYYIKAENGESVSECKNRMSQCIKGLCEQHDDKCILIVSHPFVCQISSNVILSKGHTILTEFWQKKGSCMIIGFSKGKYGIKWEFQNAFSAVSNTSYTKDEIYNAILGRQGPHPS